MPLAQTLKAFLDSNEVPYELVAHRRAPTSLRAAETAHVEADRIAKAVLLEDDDHKREYTMAVLPASRRVQLHLLSECVGRSVHLATERDAAVLFSDCEAGAIPPVGPAYGVQTVWEEELINSPELFFEAGDHEGFVHMKTEDFVRLLAECPRGHFSDQG